MALNARHFVAAGAALALGAQSQDANATPESDVDQQGVVTMYKVGQKLDDEFATIGIRTQIKNNVQLSQDITELPFGGETPQVEMICGYRIVLTNGVDGITEGCLMVYDKDGNVMQKLTAADYSFIGKAGGLFTEDGGAEKNGLASMINYEGEKKEIVFFTFDESSPKKLLSLQKTVDIPYLDGEHASQEAFLDGSYYIRTNVGRIIKISSTGESSAYEISNDFGGGDMMAIPNFPGVDGGAIALATSNNGSGNRVDILDRENPLKVIATFPVGENHIDHVKVDPSGQFLVMTGIAKMEIFDIKNQSNKAKVGPGIAGVFTFGSNGTIILDDGTVTITNEDPLTATFTNLQGQTDKMTSGGITFFVNDSDNDGYDDEADTAPYDPTLPKAATTVTPPPEDDTGGDTGTKDNDANGSSDTDSGKPNVAEDPQTEPDTATPTGVDAGGPGEPKPNPNPVTGNPDQPGTNGADAGPSVSANTGSGGACDASGKPIEAGKKGPWALLAAGMVALTRMLRKKGDKTSQVSADVRDRIESV